MIRSDMKVVGYWWMINIFSLSHITVTHTRHISWSPPLRHWPLQTSIRRWLSLDCSESKTLADADCLTAILWCCCCWWPLRGWWCWCTCEAGPGHATTGLTPHWSQTWAVSPRPEPRHLNISTQYYWLYCVISHFYANLCSVLRETEDKDNWEQNRDVESE